MAIFSDILLQNYFSFLNYLYLDLGDTEALLSEYDRTLSKDVSEDDIPATLNAASLLWRLNVMGIDAGEERWSKVTDSLMKHLHNHRSPWLIC